MVKADNEITSLAWSTDSSLFAYTDGNTIIIRDASTYAIRQTINTNYKKILNIQFIQPIFSPPDPDYITPEEDSSVQDIQNLMPDEENESEDMDEYSGESNLSDEDDFIIQDVRKKSNREHYLLIATESGTVEIRLLSVLEDDIGNKTYTADIIYQLEGEPSLKLTAFKSTNDVRFIALGYEDGSFSLYNYNSLTNEYIEESYEIGETPITSIDINSDQNLLLTCTDNGITYIWDNGMNEISSFPYYSDSLQKVYFNDDSNAPIICASDDYTIIKRNLYGRTRNDYAMKTETPVVSYAVSIDRKSVLIQDESNTINVYDLNSSQFIGMIPDFSTSAITHFQIDNTQTRFLISHEDNSVFILETNKILFPKNAAIPNAKIVHMDEPDAMDELMKYDEPGEGLGEGLGPGDGSGLGDGTGEGTGGSGTGTGTGDGTAEDGKHKYEALAMIRYKNTDAIGFRIKGSVAPGPYILGTSFAAGYTAYKLIQPFYFGGYLEPHIGFPQKDFPYKYQMNGSDISSPLIVGGKLYVPFGICVFPFQKNIEFFVDIAPGIVVNMLWNTKFGGNAITSKLFTGFYGAIRTGATYKNFSVFLEGNFDAVVGFGVSIGIGYNIPISYTLQIEEAPKSLEEQ